MAEIKSSIIDLKTLHLDYAFSRGVNFEKRTITIAPDIDHSTFLLIDAALTEMESGSGAKVTIRINSVGGSVYDALAIVGRMRASRCKIVTEAYGAVMSAALLVLAAGDRRKMSHLAWVMHHASSYESFGTHKQNKELVEQRDREEQQWANTMEELTEKDAEFWYERGLQSDFYLNANEAKILGVIDEII